MEASAPEDLTENGLRRLGSLNVRRMRGHCEKSIAFASQRSCEASLPLC
jgi:hypothetical protein